jgi:hypothetical protein
MKRKRKKRRFEDDNLEALSQIRKPVPRPSRAMKSKDTYDRKDKSWMRDLDD